MMAHNARENKVPTDFGDDWNGEPCQHEQVSLQAHNQKILFVQSRRSILEEVEAVCNATSKSFPKEIFKLSYLNTA